MFVVAIGRYMQFNTPVVNDRAYTVRKHDEMKSERCHLSGIFALRFFAFRSLSIVFVSAYFSCRCDASAYTPRRQRGGQTGHTKGQPLITCVQARANCLQLALQLLDACLNTLFQCQVLGLLLTVQSEPVAVGSLPDYNHH